MNTRSLTASKAGIAKANRRMNDKGWSRQDLADAVVIGNKIGISIQPVEHFLQGKAVDRLYFLGICKALDLDWKDIVQQSSEPSPPSSPPLSTETNRRDYLAAIQSAQQRVWISQTWLPGTEMEGDNLCKTQATDVRLVLLSFRERSPIYGRLIGRSMSIEGAQNNSAHSIKAFTDCKRFECIRFNYGHHPGWIAVVDSLVFYGPTPIDKDSHSVEFLFQKYADDSQAGTFWIGQFETIWNKYSHTFEEETNYNKELLKLV